MRYFTLVMGVLVILYSLYYITQINSDMHFMKKALPFLIMFLAYNAVHKNLFNLNKVTLTQDSIRFSYLGKKGKSIFYADMTRLTADYDNGKRFIIYYQENGVESQYYFSMIFTGTIEMINFIKVLAPQITMDDFVSSLIYDLKAELREAKDAEE